MAVDIIESSGTFLNTEHAPPTPTSSEVYENLSIHKMKNNKYVSSDGITAELMKAVSSTFRSEIDSWGMKYYHLKPDPKGWL